MKPVPENESLHRYTSETWDKILQGWKRGWLSDSEYQALTNYLEFERQRIMKGEKSDEYDWLGDWKRAKILHDLHIDYVSNVNRHNTGVREMWLEWHRETKTYVLGLGHEALKAMIVLCGASIIAAFSVISGETNPSNRTVEIVARVSIFTSVVSLMMIATGNAILAYKFEQIAGRIRGSLTGNIRHGRLHAIGRYLRLYFDNYAKIASALIYGSIALFGITAIIYAFMLTFS